MKKKVLLTIILGIFIFNMAIVYSDYEFNNYYDGCHINWDCDLGEADAPWDVESVPNYGEEAQACYEKYSDTIAASFYVKLGSVSDVSILEEAYSSKGAGPLFEYNGNPLSPEFTCLGGRVAKDPQAYGLPLGKCDAGDPSITISNEKATYQCSGHNGGDENSIFNVVCGPPECPSYDESYGIEAKCYKAYKKDDSGTCIESPSGGSCDYNQDTISGDGFYWGFVQGNNCDLSCEDKEVVETVGDALLQVGYDLGIGPDGGYCECSALASGQTTPDGKFVCAGFPEGGGGVQYAWRDVNENLFLIYSINNGQTNIISNTNEWFYCNANIVDSNPIINSPDNKQISAYQTFADIAEVTFSKTDPNAPDTIGQQSGVTGCDDIENDFGGCVPSTTPTTGTTGGQEQIENNLDPTGYNYDISKSFICYNENGNNFIAECCIPGRCDNSFRVSADSPQRAFGSGSVISSIETFDGYANYQVIDNPKGTTTFYPNQGLHIITTVTIPEKMQDIVNYDSLNFRIAFNYGENIKIRLYDDSNIFLDDYVSKYSTNLYTNMRWHSIHMPLLDSFPDKITKIEIYAESAYLSNEQHVAVDNFYFGDHPYYCSQGVWLDELDPEESAKWAAHEIDINFFEYACNEIEGYGWTGQRCCGDNTAIWDIETYTDNQGGCYLGIPVVVESAVSESTKDKNYDDLLWAKSSNLGEDDPGEFYQCDFYNDWPTKYEQITIEKVGDGQTSVEIKGKCSVPGQSYFCDYKNRKSSWNNETVTGTDGTEYDSSERTASKKIYASSPQMISNSVFGSAESCCPSDFCWDGEKCVDGTPDSKVPNQGLYNGAAIWSNVSLVDNPSWKPDVNNPTAVTFYQDPDSGDYSYFVFQDSNARALDLSTGGWSDPVDISDWMHDSPDAVTSYQNEDNDIIYLSFADGKFSSLNNDGWSAPVDLCSDTSEFISWPLEVSSPDAISFYKNSHGRYTYYVSQGSELWGLTEEGRWENVFHNFHFNGETPDAATSYFNDNTGEFMYIYVVGSKVYTNVLGEDHYSLPIDDLCALGDDIWPQEICEPDAITYYRDPNTLDYAYFVSQGSTAKLLVGASSLLDPGSGTWSDLDMSNWLLNQPDAITFYQDPVTNKYTYFVTQGVYIASLDLDSGTWSDLISLAAWPQDICNPDAVTFYKDAYNNVTIYFVIQDKIIRSLSLVDGGRWSEPFNMSEIDDEDWPEEICQPDAVTFYKKEKDLIFVFFKDSQMWTLTYGMSWFDSTANSAVSCQNGEWKKIEKKYSPHHDYQGFCNMNSQCYFGNDTEGICYDDGEVVEIKDELTDFYCDNGNWTSRTKILADTMLDIPDKTFTLFCDDSVYSLNQDTAIIYGEPISILELSVDMKENIVDEDSIKRSACVLTIDENGDNVFGGIDDKVYIGIPLKNKDIDFINDICPEADPYNIYYADCGDSFYYNAYYNLLIFSQQEDIDFPCTATGTCSGWDKFINAIGNWISEFLNIGIQVDGMDDFEALVHDDSDEFEYSNMLYNHLYYYEDSSSSKTIAGVKEYKFDDGKYKYALFTKYVGFNANICQKITIADEDIFTTVKTLEPGTNSKITCSEDDTTIIMELLPQEEINNYWSDITAKLRPIE